jgi:ABC-type phosphate/phosphonate transport system permease subunit
VMQVAAAGTLLGGLLALPFLNSVTAANRRPAPALDETPLASGEQSVT